MLKEILQEFEQVERPLQLDELSQRLGIERSALDGMIAYWIRKGRIKEVTAQPVCGATGCGIVCSTQPQDCPFAGKMPRMFVLDDVQGFK